MRSLRIAKTAVLVTAIAVCTGSCSLMPGGDDKIHITADFDNVAGLYEGNEVAVLGLPMGKVDKVTPKGTIVEVEMSVDKDVKIPADVKAATISPQLVTNRHVELTPAYSGKGPTLQDGAHIPLERTRTPVALDKILKTLDDIAGSLKGSGAKDQGPLSLRILYPTLNGQGDKIRETLDALAGALKVGVANKDQISNTIIKLNDLTTMVAENDQTVRNFSNQTTKLTGLLAEQAPGLKAVLQEIDQFLANTSSVLAQNKDQLGGALTRLTGTTEQLRQNAAQLTEFVDVGPLLFQNITNTMNTKEGAIRLHGLTDKGLLDGEALNLFCEKVQMRAEGCRSGKLKDFGPDLGMTSAMLGITR